MARRQPYTARLLIGCADQPGIVAAVSGFLFEQGANIVSSHQYSTDPTGGRFFMRTEFFLRELAARAGAAEVRRRFEKLFAAEVADGLGMDWEIRYWGQRRRIAILVSRHDHCLVDLLWRWRRDELDGEVVAVVSNHDDLRRETEAAGVPFHHVPVAGREQARGRGGDARAAGGRGRPARARPLHADSQRRLPARAWACRRSTSTTPSCRRSRAPTPTAGRASGASS